jgi:hypothetical protein
LKCHFLHAEHYVVLTVLVFHVKIKKSYVIWWPAVLVLEYLLAYSKINRFNIISSIHNSNMEYHLQGGAKYH